jgi:hypothetical protein
MAASATMTMRRAALHPSTYAALALTGLGLFTAFPGITSFFLHLFLGFPLIMLVVALGHWEGRRFERKHLQETAAHGNRCPVCHRDGG